MESAWYNSPKVWVFISFIMESSYCSSISYWYSLMYWFCSMTFSMLHWNCSYLVLAPALDPSVAFLEPLGPPRWRSSRSGPGPPPLEAGVDVIEFTSMFLWWILTLIFLLYTIDDPLLVASPPSLVTYLLVVSSRPSVTKLEEESSSSSIVASCIFVFPVEEQDLID